MSLNERYIFFIQSIFQNMEHYQNILLIQLQNRKFH